MAVWQKILLEGGGVNIRNISFNTDKDLETIKPLQSLLLLACNVICMDSKTTETKPRKDSKEQESHFSIEEKDYRAPFEKLS